LILARKKTKKKSKQRNTKTTYKKENKPKKGGKTFLKNTLEKDQTYFHAM
jgi:hypothetical protein